MGTMIEVGSCVEMIGASNKSLYSNGDKGIVCSISNGYVEVKLKRPSGLWHRVTCKESNVIPAKKFEFKNGKKETLDKRGMKKSSLKLKLEAIEYASVSGPELKERIDNLGITKRNLARMCELSEGSLHNVLSRNKVTVSMFELINNGIEKIKEESGYDC